MVHILLFQTQTTLDNLVSVMFCVQIMDRFVAHDMFLYACFTDDTIRALKELFWYVDKNVKWL